MISPVSREYSILNENRISPTSFAAFFNHVERQFGKKINRILTDNGGKYISNELKDFFFTSGVFHELTPPYSPESNGIAEYFNQTINTITDSITIGGPDFHCLWAEAIKMGPYLKNRLLHKHPPLSTTPCERFHSNRPTISHLKPFGSKYSVHI
jgi:transposase InsO family protein